ncbi:MAG TPA: hypothetical protein VGB26_08210 [Nitrospiria bacterium]|jgi:hypothetical protein
MGRTLATFTMQINHALEEWGKFKRALRKEDQAVLEGLFAHARYHAQAGAYFAPTDAFSAMLLSMLLEERKASLALQSKVKELEVRFAKRA